MWLVFSRLYSFLRNSLDQDYVSLYPFVYFCLFKWSTQLKIQKDMDFFKIRIHVCHHVLVFSNTVLFSVLFWGIPGLRPPQSFLWGLVFFLVLIHLVFLQYSFCSHILVQNCFVYSTFCCCLFSCILLRLVGKTFFCYFGRSYFLCIAWPCLGIL